MKKDTIYEIKSLENAISRYIFSNVKEDRKLPPPSPMQVRIMEYLIENQGKDIYQRDLEDVFKVRRASISGVLQTMEKRGLVKKVISKEDGRANKIILTQMAIKKQKEVSIAFMELEKKLTKNIDKEKMELFHEIIKQMKNNIEGSQ